MIKAVQREEFAADIEALGRINHHDLKDCWLIKEKKVLKKSHLYRLDPFLDGDGVLRVGGRLYHSDLELSDKLPILLPKGHNLSKLVIRYYHGKVHHQGHWRPWNGGEDDEHLCNMQKVQRRDGYTTHGQSTNRQNRDHPTVYECWF